MTPQLWLLPALPFLGFLINGALALFGSRTEHGPSRGLSGFLGVLFPLATFILVVLAWQGLFLERDSILRLNHDLGLGLGIPPVKPFGQVLWTWIQTGELNVDFGFRFDELAGIMLLFITGIGTLIHLYSVGYMAHDRGFARFMAYMNLFLANMVVLVLGNGPLVTFMGWEGVGLCSYLLIGFWHHDASNGAAAKKAFLVNRAGDLGFLLGLFLLWQVLGTGTPLTYEAIANWFRDPAHAVLLASAPVAALVTASTLLLLLGATGKSAQIPLLTWLPDAMAGPTPVSALIHAATMVTSGVFLLARLSDVFAHAPLTLEVVAWIGAGTAAWAAVTGLVQTDIKKILAYSTISQLGYMFLAAGVGAFDAGVFHVFTHAFFKGVLFLGAGSVIHALSGEQDVRRMGGLWRKLPLTFAAMFCGWYAIVGLPFGAGFWSKDLILEKVLLRGGPALYLVALATAVVTAVYMTRMMILVFWSKPRLSPEAASHLHESPLTMQIPMWVLGFGSLVAGFAWADPFHLDWFSRHMSESVGPAQALLGAGAGGGPSAILLESVGVVASLLGILVAVALHRSGKFRENSTGPLSMPARAWTLLFDGIHGVAGIWPVRILSWILDNIVQPLLVGMARVFGWCVEMAGGAARMAQTPRLRWNLGLSVLGLVALLILLARNIL